LAGREKQVFISDPDATGEKLLGELADLVALVGTALLHDFDQLSFPLLFPNEWVIFLGVHKRG
jgi:hypothetical protein